MTPRERAEALVDCLDDVWTFTGAVALIETALDEHARALLADDEAMTEEIADRLGSWLRPGLDARYVARAVLAALRGKAFAQ
jgi:hypothetical protein